MTDDLGPRDHCKDCDCILTSWEGEDYCRTCVRSHCEECDGEGNIWNNADPTSGQRVDCEHCTSLYIPPHTPKGLPTS